MFYRLSGIHKAFGEKQVLKGIDLEIEKGETLVILGGSGTGKSVLLRMLIGLIQADSGTILFEGKDITRLREKDYYPIRKRVSYLFQGGALFDSMNVYRNLAYPLREHSKLTHKEILPVVRKSLARVELDNIEHLFPSDLSGGMMKRVALARAIINEPEIVLYDEPTTGLDPLTTKTINRMIRKMQTELKITSVVVTHDMSTANHVADRLAFLEQGRLAFVGTLAEAARSDHRMLRAYLEGGKT
ncbi:MAG: ATP-binding cassette domain-containing protein [Acidobacteriota bacterium]|nr:ATP-binding cassette domain-containing protein [Acidobacteriota bacterium]